MIKNSPKYDQKSAEVCWKNPLKTENLAFSQKSQNFLNWSDFDSI